MLELSLRTRNVPSNQCINYHKKEQDFKFAAQIQIIMLKLSGLFFESRNLYYKLVPFRQSLKVFKDDRNIKGS